MGTADALRRAIPEFLDWADSALPPVAGSQPPFVAAFHDLLLRYSQLDDGELPQLLTETRGLWREHADAATEPEQVFAQADEPDTRREKPRKRRY